MKKKTLAILLGAAAGLGSVLLLLRKFGHILRTRNVEVLVMKDKDGVCRVASLEPDEVELSKHRGDKVHWWIENADCATVTVCVDRWKKGGASTDAPVKFDDDQKCTHVHKGQRKPIKAKAKLFAGNGDYKYSIEINGAEVLDPIVRIVD